MIVDYILNWNEVAENIVNQLKSHFSFANAKLSIFGADRLWSAKGKIPDLTGLQILKKITVVPNSPEQINISLNGRGIITTATPTTKPISVEMSSVFLLHDSQKLLGSGLKADTVILLETIELGVLNE